MRWNGRWCAAILFRIVSRIGTADAFGASIEHGIALDCADVKANCIAYRAADIYADGTANEYSNSASHEFANDESDGRADGTELTQRATIVYPLV